MCKKKVCKGGRPCQTDCLHENFDLWESMHSEGVPCREERAPTPHLHAARSLVIALPGQQQQPPPKKRANKAGGFWATTYLLFFLSLRAAVAASWLRLSPVPSSPSCIIDNEGRDRLICSLFWLASHYRSRSELGAPPPHLLYSVSIALLVSLRAKTAFKFCEGESIRLGVFPISPQKRVVLCGVRGKKEGAVQVPKTELDRQLGRKGKKWRADVDCRGGFIFRLGGKTSLPLPLSFFALDAFSQFSLDVPPPPPLSRAAVMTLQKSSPFPPRPFSSLPFPFLSPCLAVEKGRGLRRGKGTGEEEGKLWNPFPRKGGEETWEVPRHRLRTGEAPSTSFFCNTLLLRYMYTTWS